jgi:hypothetical protein
MPTSLAGAFCRGRDLVGDARVEAFGSRRQVPGTLIPVDLEVKRLGQCAMNCTPLGRRCTLVHGGSDEWVPELQRHPLHKHDAGPLRDRQRAFRYTQISGGAQDRRQPCAVVGRDDQQEKLRRLGQPLHTLEEEPLHVSG